MNKKITQMLLLLTVVVLIGIPEALADNNIQLHLDAANITSDECNGCHDVLNEISLDPNIKTAHNAHLSSGILKFECNTCHRSVDLTDESSAALRRQVDTGFCAECHLPFPIKMDSTYKNIYCISCHSNWKEKMASATFVDLNAVTSIDCYGCHASRDLFIGATTIGTITGLVTNGSSGLGVSGALVMLVRYPENNATTLADGSYIIGNVPFGTYDIAAIAAGYMDNVTTVNVTGAVVKDFTLTTGEVTGNYPAPPVNQNIGTYDTSVNKLAEPNCRNCHSSGVPDRHHNLVPTLEYVCTDCHPFVNNLLLLDRNCINCHNGSAFYANTGLKPGKPHHNTTDAQDRNCKLCHGSMVDNYNDEHYIPSYNPSLVTPDTSFKVYNSTTGKKWGGCEACHTGKLGLVDENNISVTPNIFTNRNTHHTELIGVTNGGPGKSINSTTGDGCNWCHVDGALNIRKCEDCHSVSTIHNIQYNYTITNGLKGYGHIGDNWDCNGCHAFWNAGASGFEGAIIPNLASITPGKFDSNKDTTITIDGSDFLSGVGTYTAVVIIDETTTITPVSVTENKIVANLNLPAGVHTIKVVKNGDFVPKTSQLFSLTVVDPVDAVTAKITKKAAKGQPAEITITGTGFGLKPEPLTDPLYNKYGIWITTSGKTVKTTVNSWTDTMIVVTIPKANEGDPVTVRALSGEDTVTIDGVSIPTPTPIPTKTPKPPRR